MTGDELPDCPFSMAGANTGGVNVLSMETRGLDAESNVLGMYPIDLTRLVLSFLLNSSGSVTGSGVCIPETWRGFKVEMYF